MTYLLIFVPISLSIIYSAYIIFWLSKQPSGNEKMVAISLAIYEGSRAYLNRQYRTIAVVALLLLILLFFTLNKIIALGFLLGASSSAFAGYLGMMVAVRSNSKTAAAASNGLSSALTLAFRAGSVTGFLVVALALLFISGLYFLTSDTEVLIGFGFGASLISVFARLGGGIFTKAADVGTDLVGKIEVGIPEDDPRNPGVIADNVGDNVGDCAGMAADLFETYAVTTVAAMFLGSLMFPNFDGITLFPLVVGGVGVAATIISVLASSFIPYMKVMKNLYCS